jgi:hypothetical protein
VFTGLEGKDLAELSAAGRKRFMLCKKLKSEIHITDASQVILFDMVNGDVPASAKRKPGKPDLVEDNKEALSVLRCVKSSILVHLRLISPI